MGEGQRPGLGTRIRAAMASERSAEVLEAMRGAGKAVYEELPHADAVREKRKVAGVTSWACPPAEASHLVATHNALMLQTLGEELLDSDYRSDPGTRGYVPEPIFSQVWWWFSAVPQWLSRARQARSNPDYDLRHELRLPVDLPPWQADTETTARFVDALVAVVPRMRRHTEYTVYALAEHQHPDSVSAVNQLKQMLAAADTTVDYVASVRRASPDGILDALWEQLRRAVDSYFHVGQLAEFPALTSGTPGASGASAALRIGRPVPRCDPRSVPGGSQFDPWCLTDPGTVEHWRAQEAARREIDALWAVDPHPSTTLQVKAEIDAALAAGDVVRVKLDTGATCYFRCPWSSLYEVWRPVTIHRTRFGVFQHFTFDVSAELLRRGGPFVRELVPGPFSTS